MAIFQNSRCIFVSYEEICLTEDPADFHNLFLFLFDLSNWSHLQCRVVREGRGGVVDARVPCHFQRVPLKVRLYTLYMHK